jgi:hypothetical protein
LYKPCGHDPARAGAKMFICRLISRLSGQLILCAALVSPATVGAQSPATNGPQESQGNPSVSAKEPPIEIPGDMEEVIVFGERQLNLIRRELVTAENLVFDMFNELNEQDEYDMICLKEARIGSQIRFRVCKPGFMLNAEEEAAEEYLVDIQSDGISQSSPFRGDWKRKSLQQRELMAKLANENPQFLELLKKRLELRHEYEASQAIRWQRKRKD